MQTIEQLIARAESAEREVERLTKQIKDDNRSYGCELRDPYGTIWEQATKDHARAERAEAKLKEWSPLNLWGDTPEIIHAFVKGQQARIQAAQDVEAELESTKERALTLANSLDQAQTELAELKESVLVQRIFSDDRIRADEAEHDCRVLIGQLNDALAELDGIRALAGRNKRYCFKGTARELVAALDQALDIAQAELKAEQDIRVINEIELKVSRDIVSKIWVQLGSPTYEQLKGRSIYDLIYELKAELAAERARLDWLMAGGVCMVQHTGGFHVSRLHAPVSRAAIDAAMKEGAQ